MTDIPPVTSAPELAALGDAVARVTTPAQVHALLAQLEADAETRVSRQLHAWDLVMAARAPVFDAALISRWTRTIVLIDALASNPALTLPAHAEFVPMVQAAIIRALREDARLGAASPMSALARLARHGLATGADPALVARIEGAGAERGYFGCELRTRETLLTLPDLPEAALLRLAGQSMHEVHGRLLLRQRHVTAGVLLALVRANRHPTFLRALLDEAPTTMLAHRTVRLALARHVAVVDRVRVCLAARGAEFRQQWLRLRQPTSNAQAAAVLQQASPTQVATLTQADLAPLLTSHEAPARLAAITAMGFARDARTSDAAVTILAIATRGAGC